jgi:hypothetical protein
LARDSDEGPNWISGIVDAPRPGPGTAEQLRAGESGQAASSWPESLLRDFRFGRRRIAKYRTASLAAIISLALVIGACTAAFTLVDALIFRPLASHWAICGTGWNGGGGLGPDGFGSLSCRAGPPILGKSPSHRIAIELND